MPKDTSKVQHFEAPSSAGKPDIVLVSSDNVKFNLHLKHLEIASELIADMTEGATRVAGEPIKLTDKASERAAVLDLVAEYFYNMRPAKLEEKPEELLVDMLAMSHKWGVHRAHEAAGNELARRIPKNALEAYCLAIKYEHANLQTAVESRAADSRRFRRDPIACIAMMGARGVVELQMVQIKQLKAKRHVTYELFKEYMVDTDGIGHNKSRRDHLSRQRTDIRKHIALETKVEMFSDDSDEELSDS